MKIAIAVIILSLLTLNPLNSVAYRRTVTVKTTTDGFKLSDETEHKIEVGISKIYEHFKALFDLKYRDAPTFRNLIFEKKHDYQKRALKFGLGGNSHQGFFTPSVNKGFTWKHNSDDELLKTMYHESTHRLVSRKLVRCPVWLNEGLATFYGNAQINGSSIVIYPEIWRDRTMKQFVRNGTIVPLKTLFRKTSGNFYTFTIGGQMAGYEMSWSVVYFMMESHSGKAILKKIADNFRESPRNRVMAEDIIDMNYTGGFKKFESDWHSWIRKERTSQRL